MEKRNEIFDINCVAEVDLIYNNPVKPSLRPKINSARQAYELFIENWDMGKIELQEHFKIMFLNRGGKALGIYTLSAGGMHGTVVDNKLLFAAALKANACKIILAHNHPSGSLQPSSADIEITRGIVAAGKLLDIKVNDHLIITRDEYFSFSDNGYI
ncbi:MULTISPECIES: JAB domain-containing protein [Sphingobacterium]|uniref:JAB domain-containing protein n=1 Tax=Sphingobacterium TaxID=28453 RepID=UPI0028B23FCB|nr:JAB domain-containing protein [Sphingobacterium multivorum]